MIFATLLPRHRTDITAVAVVLVVGFARGHGASRKRLRWPLPDFMVDGTVGPTHDVCIASRTTSSEMLSSGGVVVVGVWGWGNEGERRLRGSLWISGLSIASWHRAWVR